MVRIYPFDALIPAPDQAALVAARITGNTTEQDEIAYLRQHEFSFLHVVKPHLAVPPGSSTADFLAYARHKTDELVANGILKPAGHSSVYVYEKTGTDGQVFTGLIAGVSAIDYLEGVIRKHEYTLPEKEEAMVAHIASTGVNGEPVLLSCPDGELLQAWCERHSTDQPHLDFVDSAACRHRLWVVSDQEAIESIQFKMSAKEALYIADGHHRIAAITDFLARKHSERNWSSKQMFFMAYILAEHKLSIKPFHRFIKGVSDTLVQQMLKAAEEKFAVERLETPELPRCKGEFVACTKLGWYRFIFRFEPDYGSPARNLDVTRLEQFIFRELLEIEDSKTDERLAFVRGDMPLERVGQVIAAGNADIAFALYPNSMQEVKEVADADETMPPKSTWIEPKLPTGMIIQRFFGNQ